MHTNTLRQGYNDDLITDKPYKEWLEDKMITMYNKSIELEELIDNMQDIFKQMKETDK